MDTWKEFEQNVISHSAAHHLMAIDDLVGRLGYARVSDIARQLNITRGSVSISLKPLKEAGLIVQDENRHLRLSASGQRLVDAVKTKRRLIQRLLTELLGVDPATRRPGNWWPSSAFSTRTRSWPGSSWPAGASSTPSAPPTRSSVRRVPISAWRVTSPNREPERAPGPAPSATVSSEYHEHYAA